MTQASVLAPGRVSAMRSVQLGTYILLVLCAALAGYVYTLRTGGIFSCPAGGYGGDRYLAYCHAEQYGDYDHGAFWFALEPGIRDYVARAEVLFLGNSRVQFGFSGAATDAWMHALPARHFLLGFAYWENYTFERELVRRIGPRPAAYVINIDDFFETRETDVARSVMQNDSLRGHYRVKRIWQWPHRLLCSPLPALCGGNEAFFRSLSTGEYQRFAADWERIPVAYEQSVDRRMLADYTARASQFLDSLPVSRGCIVMTIVPSSHTRMGTARALAQALGVEFVAPELPDLTTFDRSHLNVDSAGRWSTAFFETAGPRIRRCVDERRGTEH